MKLTISGLPTDYDRPRLIQLFANYGRVKSAIIVFDPIKIQGSGRAVIEMAAEEQAIAAIAGLEGKDIGGYQPVHIKMMKKK